MMFQLLEAGVRILWVMGMVQAEAEVKKQGPWL